MEERVKELFSNEEYVKGLFDLGSYEAAAAKLAEDGVETSADELKKAVELLKKKEAGELSDEELENVSGGFILGVLGMIGTYAVLAGTVTGIVVATKEIKRHCR